MGQSVDGGVEGRPPWAVKIKKRSVLVEQDGGDRHGIILQNRLAKRSDSNAAAPRRLGALIFTDPAEQMGFAELIGRTARRRSPDCAFCTKARGRSPDERLAFAARHAAPAKIAGARDFQRRTSCTDA